MMELKKSVTEPDEMGKRHKHKLRRFGISIRIITKENDGSRTGTTISHIKLGKQEILA